MNVWAIIHLLFTVVVGIVEGGVGVVNNNPSSWHIQPLLAQHLSDVQLAPNKHKSAHNMVINKATNKSPTPSQTYNNRIA